MRIDRLEEFLACVRQANSSTLSESARARVYARILWRLANERQPVDDGQTHSARVAHRLPKPS